MENIWEFKTMITDLTWWKDQQGNDYFNNGHTPQIVLLFYEKTFIKIFVLKTTNLLKYADEEGVNKCRQKWRHYRLMKELVGLDPEGKISEL
jgi:hypothetical protein